MAGSITRCPECGEEFEVPSQAGAYDPSTVSSPINSIDGNFSHAAQAVAVARVACGFLALLGSISGLHKFAMGRHFEGVIFILASLLSCFILSPIMLTIGIVEGIMYILQTDQEFYDRYIAGDRRWF